MKFQRLLLYFFSLSICLCIFFQLRNSASLNVMAGIEKKVVMLDAGHGGWDPGKVGVTGEDEKNINLHVTLLLQSYLEASGATVILTRNQDEALGDSKKKDMQARKKISAESQADILVSIHQNSFPQLGAKGAQVFYFNGSTEGETLAKLMQTRLKEQVDSTNNRLAKSNTDYYILKKPEMTTVLVECGFISNPEEEKLLNTPEYREKLAWAIYLGIVDYFNM